MSYKLVWNCMSSERHYSRSIIVLSIRRYRLWITSFVSSESTERKRGWRWSIKNSWRKTAPTAKAASASPGKHHFHGLFHIIYSISKWVQHSFEVPESMKQFFADMLLVIEVRILRNLTTIRAANYINVKEYLSDGWPIAEEEKYGLKWKLLVLFTRFLRLERYMRHQLFYIASVSYKARNMIACWQ